MSTEPTKFDLATLLFDHGDVPGALRLLDEVLAEADADQDPTSRFFALVRKSGWSREIGRMTEAAESLDAAERELSSLPHEGQEMLLAALRLEQGIAAQRTGDFDHADALLEESRRLVSGTGAADLHVPDVLVNQAAGHLALGRPEQAKRLLLAALETDERIGNVRGRAHELNMLGLVSLQLGDLDTARAHFEQSCSLASEAGYLRFAADAASNFAIVLDLRGEHDKVVRTLRELGSFWADTGDVASHACLMANRGALAARQGDVVTAEDLFMKSRELHRESGNWVHMIQDQTNLSMLANVRGDLEAALAIAENALAQAREHTLVIHMWHLEYLIASHKLELLKRDGHPDELRARWSSEATAGLNAAIDLIELLRAHAGCPEERQWLLADKEVVYETAIMFAAARGRPDEAFLLCERARSRSFLESLGVQRLRRYDPDSPSGETYQNLVDRLLDPDTPSERKHVLLDKLRTLRARTVAELPDVAVITEPALPSIEEICAAIPAYIRVLVHFVIGHKILVFLLDRQGLHDCTMVSVGEPLEQIVRRFRQEIEDDDADLEAGNLFFGALFRPAMPFLSETANLIVVPHSELHHLPYSAFWFRPAGPDAPPRQYLKNRFHLAALPSASCLPTVFKDADATYGPAIVLGDPLGDLPGAAREAAIVADLLGVPALLGEHARREAFLGAQRPGVLHVAAHGTYNHDDPLLSGLRLADGMLTVENLIEHGPATLLMVLSGCVTGLSERRPGDELVGLAQAALRGGTSAVVATLWETSDESGVLFFEHFYQALAVGIPVSEAMAWARQQVSETFDAAVDWAPFMLIGDPTTRVINESALLKLRDQAHEAHELMTRGEFTEATARYEQIRTRQLFLVGADHPDTLNTSDRLAGAYAVTGRLNEAVALFEETMAACERVFGPNDDTTAHVRDNLRRARRERDHSQLGGASRNAVCPCGSGKKYKRCHGRQ
ncbi:CHAT domain-containing protein [Nonomuraea wenchangensis]|uniref:CHAT domain-containing protein n=1 Tax=Nonomuraea wenchangensis TaxID=568860 RepID=UPI003715B2BD